MKQTELVMVKLLHGKTVCEHLLRFLRPYYKKRNFMTCKDCGKNFERFKDDHWEETEPNVPF